MCTTYLASELIQEFQDYDVIGYPRLVRLNPNIPWKTRGNGAISIRLGKGSGRKFPIAEIEGQLFQGFERGRNIEPDVNKISARIKKIVEDNAQLQDKETNPAFVILGKKPGPKLYWKGVREIVRLEEVKSLLKENGGYFKGYKNQRGLIGASAAISWKPKDRTYEIIAYRERKRWGTERKVDESSVIEMDRNFPSTFNNYDYGNRVIAISPNSPCPVLFGIRGEEPKVLPTAMKSIKSERRDRWTIFLTNHGTDDHLQTKLIFRVAKYQSVITRGTVADTPRTIKGGHVLFTLNDESSIDCAAYEPTKEFRETVRKLRKGDSVEVYGGVREKPLTINIEKLKIKGLANIEVKMSNPTCPKCGKRMKSIGKDAGYRCLKCRIKVGENYVKKLPVKRNLKKGLYEVPVCARRHLSKPLKRMES